MFKYIKFLLASMFLAFEPCVASAAVDTEKGKADFRPWRKWQSQMLLDKSRKLIEQDKNIDSAMIYMSEIVNRYYKGETSKEGTDMFIRAMNNIGYVYLYCFYEYQKAYTCYSRALKVAKQTGDKANMAYLYLNIANLYSVATIIQGDQGNVRQALDCYKQSFACAMEAKDWDGMQITVGNMVDMAYAAKQMGYIKKELKTYMSMRFPKKIPLAEYNKFMIKGDQALAKKDYAEALRCFKNMEKSVGETEGAGRYVATAYNHQAEVYSLMGDKKAVFETLGKWNNVIRKHNLKFSRVEYCKSLYELYKESGNTNKARYYELEYFKAKDVLESEGKLKKISEMQFLDQLQEANNEIIAMAKRRKLMYCIIALVCLIAATSSTAMWLVWKKNKKLKESHRVMFERMQDLLKNDDAMHRTIESYEKQVEEMKMQHEGQSQAKHPKYQNSTLGEIEKEQIYNKVCLVMSDTENICKDGFNLKKLSEMIKCPYPKVSQSINEMYGKNFNAILNDYRIKEACRRLSNKGYEHFTIEAIAASVGFKSRTTFIATFKRITGFTPSEYQRAAIYK